jgi:putative addiction module component (TIGR02574 family)
VYDLIMAATKEDIFRTALALSVVERADLIGALIESLDGGVEADVEAAWQAEIERRSSELESGAVQSIPWSVVRQRLTRA